MEQQQIEQSEKEFKRRIAYEKLKKEYMTFEDISTMYPHLLLFRNKVGKIKSLKMEISRDIINVGINAMRQEYNKKLEEAKKGTL